MENTKKKSYFLVVRKLFIYDRSFVRGREKNGKPENGSPGMDLVLKGGVFPDDVPGTGLRAEARV